LMDFVRGQVGGCRSLERPTVIFGAMRKSPNAGDVLCLGALSGQLSDLALQGGCDFACHDLASARVPIPGNILVSCAPDELVDQRSAFMCVLRRDRELAQSLVEQEAGRNDALRASRAYELQLAIELARKLREAGEIGFGIRRRLHRMIGVEEVRCVDVRTDI